VNIFLTICFSAHRSSRRVHENVAADDQEKEESAGCEVLLLLLLPLKLKL
jgi:hypothetical protein